MKKVVLMGAGGKMGQRITDNLIDSNYETDYLEVSLAGIENLKQKGIEVSDQETVIPEADIVIFGVPDIYLEKITAEVIPKMKPGAMSFTLDPAAPLAGKVHYRDDLSYFIAHPSHPSIFNWEPSEEAQADFFGGIAAKQAIMCSLTAGPESDYEIGETLAKSMYAPVFKAFNITAEQMGILEPALVETLSATCLSMVKEGLDEVISQGVPAEAAREFLLGHLNIQMAVIFQQLPGAVFSDAAIKALNYAKPILFKEDWKKIFEPNNVKQQIRQIIE